MQEKQAPIDRDLVQALIAATPETWGAAAMLVERQDDGTNEKMLIEISSPEGHADLIGPTDEIYEGLYRLSDCFRSEGKVWRTVKYEVSLSAEGNWKYQVHFSY